MYQENKRRRQGGVDIKMGLNVVIIMILCSLRFHLIGPNSPRPYNHRNNTEEGGGIVGLLFPVPGLEFL